jgi:protein arginine kinase activator
MFCQKCGQRQATVFFSQTVGNETTQAHLCEVCAQEQGQAFGVWNALNFHPLAALTGLIHQMMPWGLSEIKNGEETSTAPSVETQLQCPHCGYQLSTFRQNGRLGCTKCYESFSSYMEPLITNIHGHARHLENPETEIKTKQSVGQKPSDDPHAELREKMREAVKKEKFEEAAKIRDEINRMGIGHDVS